MKQGLLLLGVTFLTTLFSGCSKSGTDNPIPSSLQAHAGTDQSITIAGVDSTTLNGSGSGANITSFTWTKVSGPTQYTIVDPSAAKTVVKNLVQNKSYKFELRITDDMGRTAKDTVTVNVNLKPNQSPIAKAGRDTGISVPPNKYLLDGSGSSDPDGALASYHWDVVSGPTPHNNVIESPDSAKTVIKNLQLGVYEFALTVTDSSGATSQDNVIITVSFPPTANAGTDVQVFSPDNAYLDGSQSSSNNVSTTYTWTKISGPSGFNIADDHAQQTTVSNLSLGDYQFELLVKDNAGLTSKDTVTIMVKPTRPLIPFQMIPFKTLGSGSSINYSALAGNKIFFAGEGTHVDIYDLSSQTWSAASLSQARYGGMAVVALGSKVFFAGGNISSVDYTPTSTVDIYDVGSNTWTTASLSRARGDLAAAAVDDKVFFAGGYNPYDASYKTIDVYNTTTDSWSVTSLSEAKFALTGVTSGNKALFAGGFFSKAVDIFDAEAGNWKVDSLIQARGNLSSVALNGKAYFAGGETGASLSSVVDIYDGNTQSWKVDYLSRPKSSFSSAAFGNKIVFFANAGTRVDVYDQSSDTWSTAELSQPLYGATVINAGGEVYAAAGNMVWKLVF